MKQFSSLNLAEPLARALNELGHTEPTPIQSQAIPEALKGKDIMGIAQTGTGKTAAFTLPTLQHLITHEKDLPKRGARVLILAPTRELADQIGTSVRSYGRHVFDLSVSCIFGGVSISRQIKRLVYGNHVLVATPGRLIDLLDRKAITLADIEILILDEADQMMDMGFIHALKKIVPLLPKKRQTLFFSATLAPAIKKLSQQFLTDPVHISVTPANTTAEKVEQRVYRVNQAEKQNLLSVALLDQDVGRSLVFTRTKHGADRIVKRLAKVGLSAVAIHGNKSQGQRQRALEDFKSGKVDTLVATDIAARGIDIPDITHVFNFEIPNVPEQYVHRIGRTARAKKTGIAVAFVDKSEQNYLRDIEKLLKQKLPELEMPSDMIDKLKELAAREPLPAPEKPKADARKGRGKSRNKSRKSQSKTRHSGESEAKTSEAKAASPKNSSFDKPSSRKNNSTKKKWSEGEQGERRRARKKSTTRPQDQAPKREQSEEGKKAQSYSGKGYKGKPNHSSSKNTPSGPKKIKPSRARRKAARIKSGKTQKR